LDIHASAAQAQPGQLWIKRTILEMGGKDGIVIAASADLDAAADGVAASAFGFQGQKCSACSRAIVEDSVYDAFSKNFSTACESSPSAIPPKTPPWARWSTKEPCSPS